MPPSGFYRNVDTYVEYADVNKYGSTFLSKYGLSLLATNKNTVLWHDLFGTDNKYESEDVESMGITEGNFDSSAELNYFLQWDKENFLLKLKIEMNKSVQQRRAGRYVLQDETYHEKDHVVIEE